MGSFESSPARVLQSFKSLYDTLDRENLSLDLLQQVYAENAVFHDSLHRLEGLDAMFDYFTNLYENVTSIRFDWRDEAVTDTSAFVRWNMRFEHPVLKSGSPVDVAGATFLAIDNGRIVEHRDYFDAGEMLYEHVPALGYVIRKLKKRLA